MVAGVRVTVWAPGWAYLGGYRLGRGGEVRVDPVTLIVTALAAGAASALKDGTADGGQERVRRG